MNNIQAVNFLSKSIKFGKGHFLKADEEKNKHEGMLFQNRIY